MGKLNDLTGQHFGKLTVLYRAGSTKDGAAKWHCKCECGNEKDIKGYYLTSGHTTTCGCKRKETAYKVGKATMKDLTNQRFGYLIALKPTENRARTSIIWECLCDCGKIHYVSSSDLIRGSVKSCGCMKIISMQQSLIIDMIGKKFGKLTVLKQIGQDSDHTYNYLCQCECGNQKIINGCNLRNGTTQSCGCINYSIGEQNITYILKQYNINFIKEYIIKELNNKRFDFAIIIDNQVKRLIEYDGQQHFEENNFFQQSLIDIQNSDKQKNQWAKEHNIPLVRIPYWERDKITLDMIMRRPIFSKRVVSTTLFF